MSLSSYSPRAQSPKRWRKASIPMQNLPQMFQKRVPFGIPHSHAHGRKTTRLWRLQQKFCATVRTVTPFSESSHRRAAIQMPPVHKAVLHLLGNEKTLRTTLNRHRYSRTSECVQLWCVPNSPQADEHQNFFLTSGNNLALCRFQSNNVLYRFRWNIRIYCVFKFVRLSTKMSPLPRLLSKESHFSLKFVAIYWIFHHYLKVLQACAI